MPLQVEHFSLVCAVSDPDIAAKHLLASPDLALKGELESPQPPPVHLILGASCAAEAFNSIAHMHAQRPWLIWIHQDVYLPKGWLSGFTQALNDALRRWPKLAVAGVFGIAKSQTAGLVMDRGERLQGATALPSLVDSLDEMLFAVRLDAQLSLDPSLGWDFYATDLVLECQAKGWDAAVIDPTGGGSLPCEHWSRTPRAGISKALGKRIRESGERFLSKHQRGANQNKSFHTPIVRMASLDDLNRAIQACEREMAQATPIEPERMQQRLKASDVRVIREAFWLPSAQSLADASAEVIHGLRRFYRCAKLSRVWHIKHFPLGHASAHTRNEQDMPTRCEKPPQSYLGISTALASPWFVALQKREILIACEFRCDDLVDARSDTNQWLTWHALDGPWLSKLQSAAPWAWSEAMNNGFPIPAYATGAGFEGFCARIQAWQQEHLQHTIFSSSACESLLGLSDGHEESAFQIHRAQWDGLPYEVAYDQRLDPSSDDQSANNRFTASPWAHRYDHYHHARRTDLLDWVPASVRELMDWGGGEGGFLCELRNLHPHMNFWLAEISAACLEAGKQSGLNTVYSDDLSALDALRAQFDLVSLLDSLEHHSDPQALLRQIRCLLRPDAYLLLSVPHIGFWPVLYDLSEGRFEYEALGPLCETHLRFFSETGLRRLLAEANFEILRWEAVSEVMPMNPQKRSIERFSVLARRAG